jgi:uncharacterized glyoxalase superfamily protein PhnB
MSSLTTKSPAPAKKTKPIPDGFTSVTPHLICKGAAKAIDFYTKAFGATEIYRMPMPDGTTLMHAMIQIGNSFIMLADEFPDYGCFGPSHYNGTGVVIHLYVNDTDAFFNKAVKAGATSLMPPTDMFWGDRYGKLKDPFGHEWSIATHIEDLSPDEMAKRGAAAMSQGSCQ